MQLLKAILILSFFGLLNIGLNSSVMAGMNRFEKEFEKEKGAVDLVREVRRGGYDVITTDELKKMIDESRDVLIIDTMPYEASYKKTMCLAQSSFYSQFMKWKPGIARKPEVRLEKTSKTF